MKNENDIFNNIISSAKDVKLTEREKSTLFSAVDSYVKKNPAIKPEATIKSSFRGGGEMQNEIHWFNYIFQKSTRVTSFAFVALLILAGSSSFAAQGALPGELLYPVKININEGIKSFFASPNEKISFEADKVNFRLNEAETLAEKGRLTPETKDQIETGFAAHVEELEKGIDNLKSKGDLKTAFEISSKLENSLASHEVSLANLKNSEDSKNNEQIGEIIDKVQATLSSSTFARESVEKVIATSDEDDESVRAIAQSKFLAAKAQIANLGKYSNTTDISETRAKEATVSSDISSDTQIQTASKASSPSAAAKQTVNPEEDFALDDVKKSNDLINQGEEKMKKGLYKEAYDLFQRAYNTALFGSILKNLEKSEKIDEDLNLDK